MDPASITRLWKRFIELRRDYMKRQLQLHFIALFFPKHPFYAKRIPASSGTFGMEKKIGLISGGNPGLVSRQHGSLHLLLNENRNQPIGTYFFLWYREPRLGFEIQPATVLRECEAWTVVDRNSRNARVFGARYWREG